MTKSRKRTSQVKATRTAAPKAAPIRKSSAPKKTRAVKQASSVTATGYASTLRAAILAAPPSMQGGNLPVKSLSRYGRAPKRTVMAALNLLASEGLITIVNDDEFQVNERSSR